MTNTTQTSTGKEVSPVSELLPHHYKQLRARGLTDATMRAAGLRSEVNHIALAEIIGWRSWPRKCGPAIVVAYSPDFARVRPDCPANLGGKPAKYLSPKGRGVRPYFPPMLNGELQDVGRKIIVTESEFKALAIMQAGYASIGFPGVDCWHEKKSSALLPQLEQLPWSGREVGIAFDSDTADNENVSDNAKLLAAALTAHGAKVKVVRIPHGPSGEKQGADDFIAAHGVDAFHKLVNEAEEPEPVEPGMMKVSARSLLPEVEAAATIEAEKREGVSTLLYWHNAVWRYRSGAYREVEESELRARVMLRANVKAFGVTQRAVGDIVAQVKAQAFLDGDREPPCWLDGKGPWPAEETLVAANGVCHLPSLAECKPDAIIPPTPRLFALNALPYAIDPDAPSPQQWHSFLASLWGETPDCIEALQEWFGYTLTADTTQQKILMVVGPKRSGKGTIARVLTATLGPWNVAGPTLASFAMNFGLAPLVGRSLAIVSDARLSGKTDQAAVTERLLSISGEDSLTIDRKFRDPITLKLPTRLMILSNELPRLTDQSGALASRMIILPLTRSFYSQEDRQLTKKLLGELPGILLWAVAGWCRLRERGRLAVPACSQDLVDELDAISSPVGAFVDECCLLGPDFRSHTNDLFADWRRWCEQHGRQPGTREVFGRDLRAAVPSLQRVRFREDGERVWAYDGIALRGGF